MRAASFYSAQLLYVSSVPNSPRGVPPSGGCRFGALQIQIQIQILMPTISFLQILITAISVLAKAISTYMFAIGLLLVQLLNVAKPITVAMLN